MEIFERLVGIPTIMADQLLQISVMSICVFVLILCGMINLTLLTMHSVIIALIIFMCVYTSIALLLGDCTIIDITFIVINAGRLPFGVGNMDRYIIRGDNAIICAIVFSIVVSPVLIEASPIFTLFQLSVEYLLQFIYFNWVLNTSILAIISGERCVEKMAYAQQSFE